MRQTKGCLLFDWGDTLMRDHKEFQGPMKDWPMVEAIPGAAEMLSLLHPTWTLALATNAADSTESDIRLALRRVDLDQWIDKVYCSRRLGFKKPSTKFFQAILNDLHLEQTSVCMIGDSFEIDVLGAAQCGLKAVWFNERSAETYETELYSTIHDLRLLPDFIDRLM